MNDLQTLIKRLAESGDVLVEDIRMSETGGTIKVVCDTEKGISSDRLVEISKKILNDPVYDSDYAPRYRLEVSSPGIDAPLTAVRHFRKNIGREIALHHRCDDRKNPLNGQIRDVNEDGLTLAVVIKKEEHVLHIPFDKIEYATLKIKW
jgi:ribosome maturation factor RimP